MAFPDASGPQRPIDHAEDLAVFAHYLPRWTTDCGVPLSWRHYAVGMGWIGRHLARESLRLNGAMLMSQIEIGKEDRKSWTDTMRRSAEWD